MVLSDKKKSEVEALTDKQKEFIKIRVSDPAKPLQDIAKELKVTPPTISRWNGNSTIRDIIDEHSKTALQIALDAQPEAMRVLRRSLKSKDQRIAVDAAKYLTKNVLESKFVISTKPDPKIEQHVKDMDNENCVEYLEKLTNGAE